MRTLQRNKRTIYYSLYQGEEEVVEDGVYSGERVLSYGPVVETKMNISGGKGKADIELFGIENPFTMTAVTDDLKTPFNTDTIFWYGIDPSSAPHNYRCTGVSRTINQVVIALSEVDHEVEYENDNS